MSEQAKDWLQAYETFDERPFNEKIYFELVRAISVELEQLQRTLGELERGRSQMTLDDIRTRMRLGANYLIKVNNRYLEVTGAQGMREAEYGPLDLSPVNFQPFRGFKNA